jgi:hypothetical protein
MADNKNLLGKIQALLSKTTENGCSEAEMSAAMRLATKLMADNGLNQTDLAMAELGDIVEVEVGKPDSKYTSWIDSLVKLYDCKLLYWCKGSTNTIIKTLFVGYEVDVLIVKYFYNYIRELGQIKFDQYKQTEQYEKENKHTHGKTLRTHYLAGFYIGVYHKLKELLAEKQDHYTGEYGLVPTSKLDDISKFIGKVNTFKMKVKQLSGDAAFAGLEDGKSVNLNKPVNSGGEVKLLN